MTTSSGTLRDIINGRINRVWGKRLPYVSLPFWPLYPPPLQLPLPIPVFVPSFPSSSPGLSLLHLGACNGRPLFHRPHLQDFFLFSFPFSTTGYWPLAIDYWLRTLAVAGSWHLYPLHLHPLPHTSLKGEAGTGRAPVGAQLFFPHSGSYKGLICSLELQFRPTTVFAHFT